MIIVLESKQLSNRIFQNIKSQNYYSKFGYKLVGATIK